MSILNKAYLMWVGKEHYPTIADFVKEVVAVGVSKRLPSVHFAKQIAGEKGTVVFLVHDEGEYDDCASCAGKTVCPDCRKLISGVVDHLVRPDLIHLANAAKINKDCALCKGKGVVKASTGGMVKFQIAATADKGAALVMDYASFNYYLHQPRRWFFEGRNYTEKSLELAKEHKAAHFEILSETRCDDCGGKGRVPKGKVFGLFMPDRVEYIHKAGDEAEILKALEEAKVTIVSGTVLAKEPKRGCGRRKEGGFYITTSTTKKSTKTTEKVIAELVEKGVISEPEAEIKGSFAHFLTPVDYKGKRFRGMKEWNLDPDAEDEAQMILDAMDKKEVA